MVARMVHPAACLVLPRSGAVLQSSPLRVAGFPCLIVAEPGRVASLPTSYRGALLHCITAQCHRIATQSSPFSHNTNLCIVTLLPTPCTARRIADYLIVSWLSSVRSPWLPCIATQRSPFSATIQQLYRDTPLGQTMRPLCHDTIHYIVTHIRRKWAVAQPPCTCPPPPPPPFFFFSFMLLENKLPKKICYYYIYFSHFPVNQINLLKFILFIFLPVLHTVKL